MDDDLIRDIDAAAKKIAGAVAASSKKESLAKIGKVVTAHTITLDVTFDGLEVTEVKKIKSCDPVAGDRVVVLKVGTTWIAIGLIAGLR